MAKHFLKLKIFLAINDIQPELNYNIRLFSSGKSVTLKAGRSENLDVLMSGFSKDALPASVTNNLQFTDKLLYIYTSGTTGLPKAAVIKNSRLALFENIFQQ